MNTAITTSEGMILPVDALALDHLHPMARLTPLRREELASVSQREIHRRLREALPMEEWQAQSQAVYLLKGQLRLQCRNGSQCVVVGGSPETTMPLTCQQDVPVGAKTVTEVEILKIDSNLLDLTVTWDELTRPATAGNGEDSPDWTVMSGIVGARSLSDGVFSTLPPAHIEMLLSRFERVPVRKGDVILRQGDAGDFYYVVERGRCSVERMVGSSPMALAELVAGNAFGEEALISDAPRNASVTMLTDGLLLRLKKSDFLELLREPYLQRLSFEEARHRVGLGATWLDVRFPAEFQQDGLPGAINIPLNELRGALPLLDSRKEYIVYCQSGRRSAAAAFLMSQKGLHAYLLAEPYSTMGNAVSGGRT